MTLENSWSKTLELNLKSEYFDQLMNRINQEYKKNVGSIFPQKIEVFRAFELCPFDRTKVVILGQDPYPTKGHAHGLCFSCDSQVTPLPKSLKNMLKELEDDLKVSAPSHGDLSGWAEQGVLLLNTILTVQEGKPLSHANYGWEQFTNDVIEVINSQLKGVIFVLWGKPAQEKATMIDETKHKVIKAPHPSPLSAYRGFFGSKPFSKINLLLREMGKDEIKWVTE